MLVFGVCGVFAQGIVGKVAPILVEGSAEKSFRTVVRSQALSHYWTASSAIGAEALRQSSSVGKTIDYSKKVRRFEVLPTIVQQSVLAQILNQKNLIRVPLAGYEYSFPKALDQYTQEKKLNLYNWGSFVEIAYPVGQLFRGHFVRTFDEVTALAQKPVSDGTTAENAIFEAYEQSKLVKSGFFVITVAGNATTPTDVLIFDLKANKMISYNKSKEIVHSEDTVVNE